MHAPQGITRAIISMVQKEKETGNKKTIRWAVERYAEVGASVIAKLGYISDQRLVVLDRKDFCAVVKKLSPFQIKKRPSPPAAADVIGK